MNFSTPVFLLVFLPCTLVVFHGLPPRLRLAFLFLASLVFYGASGLIPLSLLVGVLVWAFALSYLVKARRALFVLWFAISVPLLALLVTKYSSFLLSTVGVDVDAYPVIDTIVAITLPAGISFYTFQIVSYLIDIRDGRIEQESGFVRYAAFVSFFPQLIAGPILRYGQISEQLARLRTERHLDIDWMRAAKYCVFGLGYKVVFADVLRNMHERYDLAPNTVDALFSVLSYSAIIYFDFWGYSLMAIGIGAMFGITLPRNFAEPYLSRSPKEFWRRWYITLSYWVRDYVYLKLAGNHHYVRNIVIVFLLVGLWHGAGWSFVVWGAYHAILVVGYRWTRNRWAALPDGAQVGLTFALVTLGWPLFYLEIGEYVRLYQTVFSFTAAAERVFGIFEWSYVACVYMWIFLVREEKVLFTQRTGIFDHPVPLALAACLSIVMLDQGRTFIYFQF